MDKKDLQVAILAGGLGTRLRGVLPNRAKSMAPVANRPFLAYLLAQLAGAGFDEVTLLTGHFGVELRRELGDTYAGMRLVHSHEWEPLGTAGAIRASLHLLTASTLLVLNGDSYHDFDLDALRRFHACRAGAVSLALACVKDSTRYGTVHLGMNDQVVSFDEKSGGGPGWINAGVYLLRRSVVEAVPGGRAVSLEREVLPAWVARGMVFGRRGAGRFTDIGTPESLAAAAEFFGVAEARLHAG